MNAPLRVDIWSDLVCPWCYIGKRKLELALTQLGDAVPIAVRYRAFQLDPTAPVGDPRPVPEVYAQRFGGVDAAQRIIDKVTGVAAEVGIEFHLDQALRANTLAAHRLLWLAAQPGTPVGQGMLKERIMRAYFCEGRDIGDAGTLAGLAAEAGMDADDVRGWLATDAGLAEVAADRQRAADYGITGVPNFVINEQWSLPGAQDPTTLVDVFERIHAEVAAA